MSETPTFLDYSEAKHSYEVTGRLREAMIWIQEIPLRWTSEDGQSLYTACPADFDNVSEHLTQLPELQSGTLRNMMNFWVFSRTYPNTSGENPLRMDRVFIGAGKALLCATVEFDPNSPDFSSEQVRAALDTQVRSGEPNATLEDHARLDNALFDLAPVKEAAAERWEDAQNNLTDQEKMLKRMMNFRFLVTPEVDKSRGPGWWTITEGNFLHTVRASSPDQAAALIDIYHESKGSGIFPLFSVGRLDDEASEKLDDQLKPDQVYRLIPFSNVPWPEDPNNMTQAQQEAFERLKRG